MKILLQTKMWVALILSFSLPLLFFSNCDRSKQGTQGPGSSSNTGGIGDGGTLSGDKLSCDQIELCKGDDCTCSGSDCCEENEKCKDTCKDSFNDGLGLHSDARDTCEHLERSVVERLFELIEKLSDPNKDKLSDIGNNDDDLELLCSAVKELDHELLADRIDKYTSSDAKKVLGWVAENEKVIEIFKNAEDKKGVPMFKSLLQKAGDGTTGDDKILAGLTVDVIVEDDDAEHVMSWAFDRGNEDLVKWIHNEIIIDRDKGLCGKEANQPTESNNDDGEQACILGVYCKIASDNKDNDNKFRKNVAEDIDSNDVDDFIRAVVSDGGLGVTNDADEWPYAACEALQAQWNNGSLDLGLDN